MSDRVIRFGKSDAQRFFTGDSWLSSILKTSYSEYEIFINANDLYEDSITKLEEIRKRALRSVVIQYVNTGRLTGPDERGRRKYHMGLNNEKPFEHFAKMRNIVLNYVAKKATIEPEFKYFVSIDSDVFVHSDAVSRLVDIMEINPDIYMCAIPVNNDRIGTKDNPRGKRWSESKYNFGYWLIFAKSADQSTARSLRSFPIDSGLLEVGYTGACCIMRTQPLVDNPSLRYTPHTYGEDLGFCHQIVKLGMKMCVDTSQVSLHYQDPRLFPADKIAFDRREIV